MQYPETKEQMLVETVVYYATDTSRRNVDLNDTCKYYPLHDNTEGCAIGRYLPAELAKKLDQEDLAGVSYKFNELPVELQKLDKDYLERIQNLHDSPITWDNKGLTEFGIKRIKGIIDDFELDESKLTEIQKYIS
jgi:hypothetical protein